jgi:hypothetical protein
MATRKKPCDSLSVAYAASSKRALSDGKRLRKRVAHGAVRGAIASMAMTGLREVTRNIGLLEEPPPESIVRQKLTRRRFRGVERGPVRAGAEVMHWSYGAAAGAVFATLPRALRRSPWAGAAFGLLVWASFELAIAPMLSLSQTRRVRVLDQLALAGDHLFYGALLYEPASQRSAEHESQG